MQETRSPINQIDTRNNIPIPTPENTMEFSRLPEASHPPKMWMLDIDGVITNATSHEIEQPIIIETILNSLRCGEPVALNTGRTLNFALQHVVPKLLESQLTEEELANFFAVGEKGATTLWHKDGKFHTWRDPELVIPEGLRGELDGFVNEYAQDTMFPGEPKPSMLSPQLKEKLPHELVEKFELEDHEKVYLYAMAMVEEAGLQDEYRVDKTKIAVDVESKRMGKQLGAQRILHWLALRNVSPQHFIGVGDSGSDAEMIEEVYRHTFIDSNIARPTVEFVFCGNQEAFTKYRISQGFDDPAYPVIYTAKNDEKKPITDHSFAEYLSREAVDIS